MSGVGIQPAGTSSAGLGSPVQSSDTANSILPDTYANMSQGSRYIDPVTRDYAVNSAGRLKGMNNVHQLVQLAVTNAEPALQKLDKLDSSFEKGVTAILRTAMEPLVAQKLVEFLGVTVRMNAAGGLKPGQAITTMRWRDLTSNVERSETI